MLKSTTLMPLISLNPATTEIKLQIHFVRTLPPLEKFISPLEMPPLPAGMQGLLLAIGESSLRCFYEFLLGSDFYCSTIVCASGTNL